MGSRRAFRSGLGKHRDGRMSCRRRWRNYGVRLKRNFKFQAPNFRETSSSKLQAQSFREAPRTNLQMEAASSPRPSPPEEERVKTRPKRIGAPLVEMRPTGCWSLLRLGQPRSANV